MRKSWFESIVCHRYCVNNQSTQYDLHFMQLFLCRHGLLTLPSPLLTSVFLGKIKEAFDRDSELQNLLLDTFFSNAVQDCQVWGRRKWTNDTLQYPHWQRHKASEETALPVYVITSMRKEHGAPWRSTRYWAVIRLLFSCDKIKADSDSACINNF